MEVWKRPVLRQEEEEERRVDWIELFFDLAFVALVSALSQGLSRHIGLDGFAHYAILFASMWVAWRYGAIYADRFETDDLSFRVSLLALMAAVVGMAVGAGDATPLGFRIFGVSYASAGAIIMTLWLRGGHHNRSFRPLARRLAVFHSVSILLWIVAVTVGPPAGWWIAAAALVADLSAPLLTASRQDELPRLSPTHLPERFGLFTIIVLGEAVFSTAVGLSRIVHPSAAAWGAGACALLLITGLYWLYFDQVMSGEPNETALRRNVTQYVHLPLAMSIAAVSAILPEFVAAPGSALSPSSRLLLSVGLAVALFSIAGLEGLTIRGAGLECLFRASRAFELAGAALLTVIGLALPVAPAVLFVGLATIIIVGIIVRNAIRRARGVCEL